MDITVQFQAKLPVKITKKAKWVLASCPILDVHSQGETEKQARRNLGEALSAFFLSCFERGTLETVLKDSGFRPIFPPAKPKKPASPWDDFINVPIPFLVSRKSGLECRA